MQEANLEQIQAVIQYDRLNKLQNDIDAIVNDFSIETRISGFDLFCQKTGEKIGTRNENSLLSMIKIFGEQDCSGNLYNATSLNVHPAWVSTDENDLDALMENDPIGYACYAFNFLTKIFYQNKKNTNPACYPASDRYWALARANAIMHERGNHDLEELNAELARSVSFMPDTLPHLFDAIAKFGNTPDALAKLHASGDLIDKLREATQKVLSGIGASRAMTKAWIQRTRFIDLAASPEDAARGPSNVRRQKVSKRQIADAVMFNEIDRLFSKQGFDLKEQLFAKTPGTTAWREAAKKREAEIALGLAELEGFTNLTFSDDEEEEDNDVIVIVPAVGLTTAKLNNENETSETAFPTEYAYKTILSMYECKKCGNIVTSENHDCLNVSETVVPIVPAIPEKEISEAMAAISREVVKTLQTAPAKPERKPSALEILRAKKRGI